jgi:hypothetical protein
MAELKGRAEFEDRAPKDGSLVVLVQITDGEVDDMGEARFLNGSWQTNVLADFQWSHWFTDPPTEVSP